MQRALEHYTDLSDIKRIMQQGGGTLNPEFLLSYFGTISRYSNLKHLNYPIPICTTSSVYINLNLLNLRTIL